MRLLRRIRYWIDRRRMAEDLRLEIEAHRAHREDALERAGASDPAAASRRAMGNMTLAEDDVRDVWVRPWIDSAARDVRIALRGLRRQPGFAIAAILTIAVGAGALTSVLAVVETVLLRPPPYPTADRIVQIGQAVDGRVRATMAPIEIAALAEAAPSFERVSFTWFSLANVTGAGLPLQTRIVYTDWQAFAMLGTPPMLGRLPTVADEAPGASPVVIVAIALRRRSDPDRPDAAGQRPRAHRDRGHALLVCLSGAVLGTGRHLGSA
jgi:hypothetical protein